MTFLTWILAGIVSGILGGLIVSRGKQRKFGVDMFVGIVGATAGGIYLAPLFDIQIVNQPSTSVATLLIGLAGSVIALAGFYLVRMLRTRTA